MQAMHILCTQLPIVTSEQRVNLGRSLPMNPRNSSIFSVLLLLSPGAPPNTVIYTQSTKFQGPSRLAQREEGRKCCLNQ